MRTVTTAFLATSVGLAGCSTVQNLENGEPRGSLPGAQTASDIAASAGELVDDIGAATTTVGRAAGKGLERTFEGLEDTFDGFATPEGRLVADPFEPVNRAIFSFNNAADRVVLEPVADAYSAVVPQTGRARVRDFVDNLKTPVWFVNETLQGDWAGARDQAVRFTLNTTVGGLGVYDFAANELGIDKHDEDFGQTLGRYGVANGPYIVLPLLGPSTLRDATGRVVDRAFDPFQWSNWQNDQEVEAAYHSTDIIDLRVRADSAIELARESQDPYVQLRSAYIQSRNARLAEAWKGTATVETEVDQYLDDDGFDDF